MGISLEAAVAAIKAPGAVNLNSANIDDADVKQLVVAGLANMEALTSLWLFNNGIA
jgi:hypothetical protein